LQQVPAIPVLGVKHESGKGIFDSSAVHAVHNGQPSKVHIFSIDYHPYRRERIAKSGNGNLGGRVSLLVEGLEDVERFREEKRTDE